MAPPAEILTISSVMPKSLKLWILGGIRGLFYVPILGMIFERFVILVRVLLVCLLLTKVVLNISL